MVLAILIITLLILIVLVTNSHHVNNTSQHIDHIIHSDNLSLFNSILHKKKVLIPQATIQTNVINSAPRFHAKSLMFKKSFIYVYKEQGICNNILHPGIIIPAITMNKINSDFPGYVIAIVTRDVYQNSSIVIPRGTKLIGYYHGNTHYSDNGRLLVYFNKMIYTNGIGISLKHTVVTDTQGVSGLLGQTHNHYLRNLGLKFLLALSHNYDDYVDNDVNSIKLSTIHSALHSLDHLGRRKLLSTQPTITINAGYKFNLIVLSDFCMPVGR